MQCNRPSVACPVLPCTRSAFSLSPRHFTHALVVFSLPSSFSSFISPRSHLYHIPHAAGISSVLFPPFLVGSFRTRAVLTCTHPFRFLPLSAQRHSLIARRVHSQVRRVLFAVCAVMHSSLPLPRCIVLTLAHRSSRSLADTIASVRLSLTV